MKRREFLYLLSGAATASVAWAHAQQRNQVRRVALLLSVTAEDSEYPSLVSTFVQSLQRLGWIDGSNVRIDVRWAGRNVRQAAIELAALAPDVILAPGAAAAGPLLQATRTLPVVFVIVPDPVGAGFVESLARPGGNATGFVSFEYSIGAKWLELLKSIAPGVARVAVIRDFDTTAGVGQFSAIQTAAPSFNLEAIPLNLRSATDVEQAIAAFAREPRGGLIGTSGATAVRYRDLIVRLAAHHKLPAIYYARAFVTAGGLMSLGSDRAEQFRRGAEYVDRILRGETPANMPVQAPTKYELVLNLKVAQALGVTVPSTLLARADEVIE
jgi:putative tryptophan/tyrosine transport system substrate-binding protein